MIFTLWVIKDFILQQYDIFLNIFPNIMSSY